MWGRRQRLSVRKYQESKKPLSLIVTIKLTKEISVLTISLPHELYMTCPVETLPALKACLQTTSLPPQWFFLSASASVSIFKCQRQDRGVEVFCTVNIDEQLHWSVNIHDRNLTPVNSPTLAYLPSILNSISCMSQIFALLDSCRLCMGNSEKKFLEVARHQQCLHQGKGSASFAEVATVHHKDCNLLLPPDSVCTWCPKCIRHRSSLQIQAKQKIKSSISRTAPSSHTNYRYLSRSELIVRLEREHHQRQIIYKQCQRLKTRIKEVSIESTINASSSTSNARG